MKTYININNKIEVKLTELGYILLFHEMNSTAAFVSNFKMKSISDFKEEAEKNEGYTSFQLWEFMSIFGEHISHGGPMVCEVEIRMNKTDLVELDEIPC